MLFSSLIPAAHQTLAIQLFSASTAPKPIERARPPYIMFFLDKYGELKHANPGMPRFFVSTGLHVDDVVLAQEFLNLFPVYANG